MASVDLRALFAAGWTALSLLTVSTTLAAPAPPPRDRPESTSKPPPESEPLPGRGCSLELEGGPRGGITVNDDQWVAGAHLRLGLLCLGGFAFEPVGLVGFGGNYLTLRPSLRAIYRVYSDTNRELEIHPTLGVSLVQWLPVGDFAAWCDRYDVDACWARAGGLEFGGGLAYRFLGIEAVAGFGKLPVVTLTLVGTFPLLGGGE